MQVEVAVRYTGHYDLVEDQLRGVLEGWAYGGSPAAVVQVERFADLRE